MRSTVLFAAAVLAAAGHGQAQQPKAASGALDFTGHIEAATVEIRPRVVGVLEKVDVKEGSLVKQGQVLAEIDPRQYQADLEVAKAKLAVAEAGAKLAAASVVRTRTASDRGLLSKEDLAQAEAEQIRSDALVRAARAEADLAQLNLSWTKLTSPIDGRVGRFTVSPGNLVTTESGPVVSVVSADPLFVAFDVDEKNMLKLRREGVAEPGKLTAAVALADEADYPHKATIDFIDPQFNSNTASVRVRGVIASPSSLMSPGMLVRVRLTSAK